MTCELCGRGRAADLLGNPFTYCPSCSLYVCGDCWGTGGSACERCAREERVVGAPLARPVAVAEAATPLATPPTQVAIAPVAAPQGRVLTTIRPSFRPPSSPAPVAPGSTRLMPVPMEGRSRVASSIRMTIGPRNGEAPTLRVPSLPWRPPAPHPPLEPAPQPRRTLVQMVTGDVLGDLPFRLAIVLMIAAGAVFVFVTWPRATVPADVSVPTSSAVATAEPRTPAASPSGPVADPAVRYTIQSGDTLRSLATRFYGNEGRWQIIYDANRAAIPNPESLTVGQEILIPRD